MLTAAQQQTWFDFIVGTQKALLSVGEVATKLGYEKDFIYDLVLEGKLEAHRPPDRERGHMRITRRSVVAYLLSSALYSPDDMVAAVLGVVETLDATQRRQLIEKLTKTPR